jgi:hypothetical protein
VSFNIIYTEIEDGKLSCDPEWPLTFTYQVQSGKFGSVDFLPEAWETDCVCDDHGNIRALEWYGEGSGWSLPLLKEFFSKTVGECTFKICWEDGSDEYLVVKSGKVFQGEVTTVVKMGEPWKPT